MVENRRTEWFDPKKVYDSGQPFSTLMRQHTEKMMGRTLRNLVPEYKQASALEVGSGNYPLIQMVPFASRTYADISFFNAQSLKIFGGNAMTVVARVEQLPFEKKSFHVAVASEVLTHVHPRNRRLAVNELARVADKILILDRCIEHDDPKLAVRKQKEKDRSPGEYVSPAKIVRQLRKLGYAVKVSYAGQNAQFLGKSVSSWGRKQKTPKLNYPVHYFILSASRQKPGETGQAPKK